MAAYLNQFIEQGTTFIAQLNLTDSNNNPYDLSSFIVTSQAKRSYYTSNVSATFIVTVQDAALGVIQLYLDSSNTANLIPGKLVYDVVINQPSSGYTSRVVEGQLIVTPGVTKVSANTANNTANTTSTDLGSVTSVATTFVNFGSV